MRLNDLDLNQLVILDALLKERNVSRAAERVFLSQSAMSSALKRLRESFHDQLLVVVGRKMVPTPLANDLAKPVAEILQQIRVITSSRPTFDPATSDRTISIVASDYAFTVFMPEVLRRVKRQAPHMHVRLRPLDYTVSRELETGEVDFTITADTLTVPGFPKELLFRERFCGIAWSQNRRINSHTTRDEFLKMGHVAMEFSSGRMPTMESEYLKAEGLSRNVEVVVPNFNVLPHFIVGTNRVATLQIQLARFYAKHLPLKIFPLNFELPTLVEVLQYHRYQEMDRACMWFRGLLKSVAKEMPELHR